MCSQRELAIEADGLSKSFRGEVAVNNLDLAVSAGSVYGFLGPNGAGKTTTIRMLATLVTPDRGTATVLGHDVIRERDAVRALISLTGQFASIDEDLTGRENLELMARLLGCSRAETRTRVTELLDVFDLHPAADRQAKTYSGGMRRRLDIAASIVVPPSVLFLDEPTTGLDPRSRHGVWEIIQVLVAGGTTVLLTTQYLEEAERLAERVAVIDRGSLITEGTIGEVKSSVGSGAVQFRLHQPGQREVATRILSTTLEAPVSSGNDPAELSAQLPTTTHGRPGRDRMAAAISRLLQAGVSFADIRFVEPSLDDVFLTLTGHRANNADNTEEEDAR